MRVFSFGEEYGPFDCEHKPKCNKQAWDCLLTDEENDNLPEQSGPATAKHILENHIGLMLCKQHLLEAIDNKN